jgi:molecular chaperone GrpE
VSLKEDKLGNTTKLLQEELQGADIISYKELQQQLIEAEEKANKNWNDLLLKQAEMDNLRRRVERDVANAHKYALEKFILELLPIIDGLERAITAHSNEESGAGSLLDGVNLTLKMFYAALEKGGVQQINPLDQLFNPELHQAVSTQADPAAKPGTVLSVLQLGYLLNSRLIRPALVIVAQ